jgi:hypothetical protein
MKRLLLLFAATLAFQANAQVATTLEVQRLAPQLVAFAGGDANFANLVNGLALGAPVTLSTGTQAFSFTPTGTMSALQIAQVLETARQSLIARGIATPTAQQLVATLAGGTLNTALGGTPVNALVNSAQSPATAVQGATSPTAATAASAAAGSTIRNMSDSPLPRGISDTPPLPVPGVTAPVQGVTAERGVAPLISTVPAATPAPAVRTGDR